MKINIKKTYDHSLASFIYRGPSMNPLLTALDVLSLIPYRDQEIQAGDVIVFLHPEDKKHICHRVLSVSPKGIKTCGDNCYAADSWILKPDEIIGRVVYAQRKKRKIFVYGGMIGQIVGGVNRKINATRRAVLKMMIFVLRFPYHLLARINFIRIQPKILSFSTSCGNEFQILVGKKVVGWKKPHRSKWRILPPYKIFIDQRSLPC